jgi:hypothetical protein
LVEVPRTPIPTHHRASHKRKVGRPRKEAEPIEVTS